MDDVYTMLYSPLTVTPMKLFQEKSKVSKMKDYHDYQSDHCEK